MLKAKLEPYTTNFQKNIHTINDTKHRLYYLDMYKNVFYLIIDDEVKEIDVFITYFFLFEYFIT